MTKVNLAQFVFDRTGLAVGEDDAVFTSHWRMSLAGLPDSIGDMNHQSRPRRSW
jgi:hypothetical protein